MMATKDDSSDDPREVLRSVALRWVETGWRTPDLGALRALHAPDFVDRSAAGREPTLEAFLAGDEELYAAFPDFLAQVEAMVIDPKEGTAAVRWAAVGTHLGPFLGIAGTGRRIRFEGIEILRVENGQIRERWGEWNGLEILRQIEGRSED